MRRSQHNPMVDMVRYQLDVSIHLADAVFSGTEKIDRAVLDVTHQAVEGQLKLARAVADMRDPTKLAELQVAIAARPERAMHCQQQIMSALVEMQAEFGKSMRNYMEQISEASAERTAETAQQLDAKSQDAAGMLANPFAGMMSAWEQAFREASRMAGENMMAARSNFETATHTAREAVSKSMEAASASPNGHAHSAHKPRSSGRRKSA